MNSNFPNLPAWGPSLKKAPSHLSIFFQQIGKDFIRNFLYCGLNGCAGQVGGGKGESVEEYPLNVSIFCSDKTY